MSSGWHRERARSTLLVAVAADRSGDVDRGRLIACSPVKLQLSKRLIDPVPPFGMRLIADDLFAADGDGDRVRIGGRGRRDVRALRDAVAHDRERGDEVL